MKQGRRGSAAACMTRRSFLSAAVATGTAQLLGCDSAATGPEGEEAEGREDGHDITADSGSTDSPAGTASAADPKVLVVYFSRADENYAGGGTEWLEVGHTKVMAGYLAQALDADQYEIVPTDPYPQGYDDCCDQALDEQATDARPTIAGDLPDVSDYETVFVGAPVWWGDEPMIVRTFLESVDLSGKVLIPFTTHGGSGLGRLPQSLANRAPMAEVLDGLAIAGTQVDSAQEDISSWAQGLNLA